ncbi:hypothetical protein DMC30DRAFT_27968 [Rhodotorula diobovata]|nr:hypothetical protein DMC30DRAFT_27968 [Rhodotorula diobovata]
MKCSRTMPCIGCEMRGTECVWLDCKPAFGMLQPTLQESRAEVVRLEKVIKQLQALVTERDGRPLPLPSVVTPPTPPYALDALPALPALPSTSFKEYSPHDSRVFDSSSLTGAPFGHPSFPSSSSSSSPNAPSWVPSTWLEPSSSMSPATPSYALQSPDALPWARSNSLEQQLRRPQYDSTVSYATILGGPPPAPPLPGAGLAPPGPSFAGDAMPVSPSWSATHSRASTWPTSAAQPTPVQFTPEALYPVHSSPSFSVGPAVQPESDFHLAALPANSSPERIPGHDTISTMLNGKRVQASFAAAEALGLTLESTQGGGGGSSSSSGGGGGGPLDPWEQLVNLPLDPPL